MTARAIHRGVASPRLKAGVFVLSGANSLSTTWFFYYIYFYTSHQFGFNSLDNFMLAASLGLVYAIFAYCGGQFAQRAGYFTSFRLGACAMLAAFLLGSQTDNLWVLLGLVVAANIGMCFTWPALQGLMSEGETPRRLRGLVGIYNVTWAGMAAFAYFTGGSMHKSWGVKSLFFVPAALMALELVFSAWLEYRVNRQPPNSAGENDKEAVFIHEHPTSPIPPKTFLTMALLANPFAYLAINTILPAIPSLAGRLHLNEALAGVVCSVWLFSRSGTFVLLWLWPKWHYRFRFLAGGFALMILCFCAMLLAQSLWVLLLSQVMLGMALGLIYHSSLFYSMEVGETKGEHGGIHESAIGAGNCGGPAIAALALALFPTQPRSGILAVGVLLLVGLGGLFWLRYRKVPRPGISSLNLNPTLNPTLKLPEMD